VVLAALPGATLVYPQTGPLPGPLRRSLNRGGQAPPPLRGYRFAAAGVFPDDLVLALRLTGPQGDCHLLHQLFGSPGNTVLVDDGGRLLWAHRLQPHPCLLDPPPRRVYAAVAAPDADVIAEFAGAGRERLARQRETAIAENLHRVLARREAAAARLVHNLTADLAGADRGDEIRRDAETLAVHLHDVAGGQAEVTLADPRDGAPRRIVLNPAAPPSVTMARLFKDARRAERGRDVIATRLEDAQRALASTQALLAELAAAPAGTTLAGLEAVLALQDRCLGEPDDPRESGVRKVAEAVARPFRRYRLQGGWEVWVGRDSAENDQLTHRDSHPRDIWLHAQGVPGSHVILRTEGKPEAVPRAILAQAAAIAALHSRARHSSLVPVIWTERRYVRKPRKSLPGIAVCLQERSLFVAPEIPADAETF
jgi:predicted ribosome quality control (RQC) complex YloA/Tae2 family protein